MKIRNRFKLIFIAIFFAVAAGAGSYFLLLSRSNQGKTPGNLLNNVFGWKYPVAKFPSTGSGRDLAYSDIRDPGGMPQGLPVRLRIPAISVDSAIEDALITPDGRMDVPAGSVNVAWFSLGPHPGQIGSAVIGGHFGISNNVPFVFYNLDKLTIGDKIYIVDDKGETLTFAVRSIKSFDRNADATTVFTSDDGLAHLNLITCEGVWNQINGNYPERLVIFTDAIPGEGAVTASVFYRSLSMGAKGVDVAALQTALEQNGFLVMPALVAKGFFGVLTAAAVVKYQTSVGLPPVGVFGPLTKAKLIAETIAAKPKFPSTAIAIPESTHQMFMQYIRVLYATPIDGFVTSFLLFSIVAVAFKTIKRKDA